MAFPKPDAAARAYLEEVLPDDPRVTVRPMFGNLAAFVDGTMFTGLFGDDLFLRLGETDRERLLSEGGAPFEPMPGRPMKEYVVAPSEWRDEVHEAKAWMQRSLAYAAALPPKKRGPK